MTGNEFRQRRMALGWKTRRMAAQEIGVSSWTVKSWERETRPVPPYAVKAMDRSQKTKGQRN